MLSVKSAVLATKLTALGNSGFFQLAVCLAKLAHAEIGKNTYWAKTDETEQPNTWEEIVFILTKQEKNAEKNSNFLF